MSRTEIIDGARVKVRMVIHELESGLGSSRAFPATVKLAEADQELRCMGVAEDKVPEEQS